MPQHTSKLWGIPVEASVMEALGMVNTKTNDTTPRDFHKEASVRARQIVDVPAMLSSEDTIVTSHQNLWNEKMNSAGSEEERAQLKKEQERFWADYTNFRNYQKEQEKPKGYTDTITKTMM